LTIIFLLLCNWKSLSSLPPKDPMPPSCTCQSRSFSKKKTRKRPKRVCKKIKFITFNFLCNINNFLIIFYFILFFHFLYRIETSPRTFTWSRKTRTPIKTFSNIHMIVQDKNTNQDFLAKIQITKPVKLRKMNNIIFLFTHTAWTRCSPKWKANPTSIFFKKEHI
jgi:hypothetical protein